MKYKVLAVAFFIMLGLCEILKTILNYTEGLSDFDINLRSHTLKVSPSILMKLVNACHQPLINIILIPFISNRKRFHYL